MNGRNCWFCRRFMIDGEGLVKQSGHLYHKFCWDGYWSNYYMNHGRLSGKELHLETLRGLTKEHEKAFGQYNAGFKVPLVLYNAPSECRRNFK